MTASPDTSPGSEIDLLVPRPLKRDLDALDRLETFLYLIPVIGILPSMWAIYRRQRDNRQLAVCRLSILLAFIWLSTYMSLNIGADVSGSSAIGFRLLFLNGLATSSYFMTSLWLMMLLWQKKSLRLPGFSTLAERTIRQN
ncbi:hypothetical protein [Chamaesiphon minutus]|uniref:Uncharacterized protein n=1 Tax=Chamaesiphon minutus (strain ATCC 27169 / PCC 6605) TaxID=1173020 RepID=K9UMT7_CHAP6|nr:hypothetical protein [Chamaesiphon minutus]AFY96130.1 hypothetical protein Cha6605_5241 [Chamaesiphon minutus PCC 6605]